MKIPDKTYIIILFIAILSLGLLSYWRFKDFDQSLKRIDLPEFEMPETNLKDFSLPEKEGYQEWSSPNGKLKFQYSANWTKMDETLLEQSSQTETSPTESRILFFAHLINLKEQTWAVLTISEIDAEKNSEEIIKIIEQDVQKQGGETEIISTKTEEKVIWIEMLSKYPNQLSLYSKAKLIFAENRTYLIVFTTLQTDWPKFEEEGKMIFDSAQLSL